MDSQKGRLVTDMHAAKCLAKPTSKPSDMSYVDSVCTCVSGASLPLNYAPPGWLLYPRSAGVSNGFESTGVFAKGSSQEAQPRQRRRGFRARAAAPPSASIMIGETRGQWQDCVMEVKSC